MHMRSTLAAAALLTSFVSAQVPVTYGNLLVVRSGDGLASLSTAAAPTFVDEYTPTGTLVQTFALPTVPSGPHRACVNSGSAVSEGQLNISSDGIFLALMGYDAPVATPIVARTQAATTNRVIAVINAFAGTIDTTTALTDAFSSSGSGNASPRAAVTHDGTQFWVGGSHSGAAGTDGIRYVSSIGATTSTMLASDLTNIRNVGVFDGQIYSCSASSADGGHYGVSAISGGLPTVPGQDIVLLNGFPNTTVGGTPSPNDFYWASPTTVYVADDRTNGSGGIQKWMDVGGTWTLQYTLALSPVIGCRSVTGVTLNGVTTLWATANHGSFTTTASEIVTVTDTGPASVVTSIIPAPLNTYLRGIRRFGPPSTFTRAVQACSATNIRCTGSGELRTDVFTTITGFAGVPVVSFGLNPVGLPLSVLGFPTCNCILGNDLLVLLVAPNGEHTLTLSTSWATLGLNVYVQGIDLLLPVGAPCPDLGLTTTDTMAFTVQ